MGLTDEEASARRAVRASRAALEADSALRALRRAVNSALDGDPAVLRQRLEVALRDSAKRYT